MKGSRSIIKVLAPNLAEAIAAHAPAEPEPTTTTSKLPRFIRLVIFLTSQDFSLDSLFLALISLYYFKFLTLMTCWSLV